MSKMVRNLVCSFACLALLAGSATAAPLIKMAAPKVFTLSGANVSGDADAALPGSVSGSVVLSVTMTGDVDGLEEFFDISLNGVNVGAAGKAFGGVVTGGVNPFTLKQSFTLTAAAFNAILAGASSTGFFGFDASSTVGANAQLPGSVYAEISAVPEPTSMAILGLGTVALAGFSRRRRK